MTDENGWSSHSDGGPRQNSCLALLARPSLAGVPVGMDAVGRAGTVVERGDPQWQTWSKNEPKTHVQMWRLQTCESAARRKEAEH